MVSTIFIVDDSSSISFRFSMQFDLFRCLILAAATTFDICKGFAFANAVSKQIRVVALLAPPPETVALFDELIVIDEGKIIYSGPTNESLPYFEALVNQQMPARADPGEWLLVSPFGPFNE
jgi:hypothetical protein